MLTTLLKSVLDPKNTILLFDESQNNLFLQCAIPLIQSGISVGVISTSIIKSLKLNVQNTTIDGVYLATHDVPNPSILCFSSGTKNHQKGIVRTFESWQNSFALIQDEITAFPDVKGIVLGSLPYSLPLFGAMESLQRGQHPLVFPNHELRYFTQLQSNQNYILWVTPLYCAFFEKALDKKHMQPIETIRYVFVGGAQFSNRQRDALKNVFPNAEIYSFYGASETSFITIKHPNDNSKSVGTICKGVQVAILDKQQQKCSKNEVGTIWVKTKDVFESYFYKAHKLKRLDNFISINDRGFIDAQNRLFFGGRAERHISISGHIMDLNAVEIWYKEALATETLAILAKPNELKENELFLMTSKQLSKSDWKSLKNSAYDTLGTQGVPKKWLHCHTWPLLANGKTDMKTLEKWL